MNALANGWSCDFCGNWHPVDGPDAPPMLIKRSERDLFPYLRCEPCSYAHKGECGTCKDTSVAALHQVEAGKYECDLCYEGRILAYADKD